MPSLVAALGLDNASFVERANNSEQVADRTSKAIAKSLGADLTAKLAKAEEVQARNTAKTLGDRLRAIQTTQKAEEQATADRLAQIEKERQAVIKQNRDEEEAIRKKYALQDSFAPVLRQNYAAKPDEKKSDKPSVGSQVNGFLGSQIASTISFVALTEAARRTMEFASSINDLSSRANISAETIQRWQFAAERSGTSIEKLIKGTEKLGVAQAKAKAGDTEMRATLQRLGLKDSQINDLKAFAQNFEIVADNISKSENSGQLFKDMEAALGRNSEELLPAMNAGLKTMGDELERMGGIIPNSEITALNEASNNFKDIWVQIRPIVGDALVFVSDRISELTALLKIGVGGIGTFFGALKGGAGFKGAVTAVQTEANKLLDERVRKDAMKNRPVDPLRTPPEETPQDKAGVARAKKEADEKKRLEKSIAEERRRTYLDTLKDENKLLFLFRERAALAKLIADPKISTNDKLRFLERKSKNENDLVDTAQKLGKTDTLSINGNQRIGAFISNPISSIEGLTKEQTTILKQIRDEIRTNNKTIRQPRKGGTLY